MGTRSYTWKHGRQLESISDGGTTWTFTYDANGMRKSRSNGSATYTYTYNGSKLMQMTRGTDVLDFYYDASGTPVAFKHNGTTYYYVTTLQGDILLILDTDGEIVVSYDYDAWGKLLAIGGSMATTLGTLNPLTYRGYVYDHEYGLYYLQSRYYSPELGRFLNADSLVSTGGLLGNNMFAYCNNNPVNGCDPCGTCFHNWSFTDCSKCAAFWKSVENGWNDFTDTVERGWNAFSKSFSITGEIGYGFGAKGKIGVVSVDATAIVLGDEWTYNTDGTTESARKMSLTVQAELIDNVNAGVDMEYSVPIQEGKEKGMFEADGGKFDIVAGAYAYNAGLGYSTISTQDIELSFGLSGYLVMGVGVEVSFNISKFIDIWNGG